MIKGQEPTIIEPERYKKRFKKAIKRYFIAMCIQNEKQFKSSEQVIEPEPSRLDEDMVLMLETMPKNEEKVEEGIPKIILT